MVKFLRRCDGNILFRGHFCVGWFFNGFAAARPLPLNVFHKLTIDFDGFEKFKTYSLRSSIFSRFSWQISVVFYTFKNWLLIIKPDSYDFSYHRKFLMGFKATITIEWNGWGHPLRSTVLGPPTIVSRWFLMVVHHQSNDAMRLTIVSVYLEARKCLNQGNKDQT